MKRGILMLAVVLAALVGLPAAGLAQTKGQQQQRQSARLSSQRPAKRADAPPPGGDTKRLATTAASPPAPKGEPGGDGNDVHGNAPPGSGRGLLHAVQGEHAGAKPTGRDEAAEDAARGIVNKDLKHTGADGAAANQFFRAYGEKVQKAFAYVISVPSLGAYAHLNRHTERWVELWQEHLDGKKPSGLAAEFGYVIETLVSDENSPYHGGAPPGYIVSTQETIGRTRPDLVLRTREGDMIAWLDVTASNSKDHIFKKDNWEDRGVSFAEVVYPSLEGAHWEAMRANRDQQGAMSKEAFAEQMEKAKREYQEKKSAWVGLGKKAGARIGKKPPPSRHDRDKELRALMRAALTLPGREPIDEDLIPSILAAMKIDPETWGFTTGFSGSERAGERWLEANFEELQRAWEPGDASSASAARAAQ